MDSRPVVKERLSGWALATVALALAMALGLCLAFTVWTASSWLAFPRFLLALGFLFVLPGSLLVRWWRLALSPIEHVVLATVLGMIGTSFLYVIAAWSGHPHFLWLWVLAGGLAFLRRWRSFPRSFRSGLGSLRRSHVLLLLALTAGWLPLATLPYYYRNLSRAGQGTFTFVDLPDVTLHASVAAELTHTVPPQVPFIAGEPLSYHIGMDLVAAVLNRYGGVTIPDLVVRFCPTLFVTLGMLAVFCLARRLLGSGGAAAAAALLAILGEDCSFIPGILHKSQTMWCVGYFQAPSVYSQYYVNPMGMALGLLFTALFCLHRSLEERRWGWIAAAALCSAALMQTKIFAFAHLALAMGVVMAVHLAAFRRLELMRQTAGIFLASLPLLLFMAVTNRDGGKFTWTWSSGLEAYVSCAFQQAQWPLLVAYPALGLIAYLALTFGFRALGLGELVKSLRPLRGRPFPLLIAVFILLGPLLTLTTKVVPRENPEEYNNAIWFLVESKYVATLLAVGALAGLWSRIGRVGRSVAVALVALASLASTVQFLYKMRESYPLHVVNAPEVETVDFLNRVAREGDVAISFIDASLLSLTKVRSPYLPLFDLSFANGEVLATRKRDMAEFWKSWERRKVREDLLLKYRVNWIVSATATSADPTREPIRGGPESGRLQQAFANRAFTVYRLLP